MKQRQGFVVFRAQYSPSCPCCVHRMKAQWDFRDDGTLAPGISSMILDRRSSRSLIFSHSLPLVHIWFPSCGRSNIGMPDVCTGILMGSSTCPADRKPRYEKLDTLNSLVERAQTRTFDMPSRKIRSAHRRAHITLEG